MQEKNAVPPSHPLPPHARSAAEDGFFPLSADARAGEDALRSYAVLDTPPEAAFDRITSLAARLFEVPVSAISLLDRDRLWFKSRGGPGRDILPHEADRSEAPCPHVIETRRALTVEDTLLDPRFSLLPLVTGPPRLRFYAGTPLLTPAGAVLGTLCLLDIQPCKFCRKKQDMLKDLAASVVSELEMRRLRLASEETETLHRQMFSENPYPMWVFDAETLRFLDVNETALALYGYTRAEFLALSVLDIQPAEERPRLAAHLRNLFASGTLGGRCGVWQHQTRGGRRIWAEVSSHPVRYGGRQARMAVAHDVSERVRTEDALRRSEQKFALHVQQMPLAAIEVAPDMTVTRWNPAAEHTFGYAAAEAVGRSVMELIVPEQEQPHVEQVRRGILSHTGGTRSTNFNRTKSGEIILCDWYNTPLVDEAGRTVGCASLARDITDEAAAQENLRRSEAHKAAILETAIDCIIGMDQNGLVTEWNPASTRTFGYSAAEAAGRSMAELIIPPRLRAAHHRGLAHFLATGEGPVLNRRIELPALHRDGREFPVELTATAVQVEGSLVFTAYVRDLSERKAMEQEREVMEREREELLAQTEALLAVALARADHDPLTGLLNHRAFHKRLKEETSKEETSKEEGAVPAEGDAGGAVLLVDLENFKFFNDAYGHLAGDDVLRRISRIFESVCRPGDVLARFGGDEFALLLPGASLETAQAMAGSLRDAAARAGYRPPGYETIIPFTLSVGLACFPNDGVTQTSLLEAADARLRVAKSGGDTDSHALLVRRSLAESVGGFTMLDALVTAVDNKDRYTRRHSEDVMHYCRQIAASLGLDAQAQQTIEIAALLHDVGKIGVPDAILRKPGRLTDDDYEAIKQHPLMGSVIVGAVPGFEEVLDAVRHHHERWDGGGYPFGLTAEETPLPARIMAVADAYSAMTTDRPYRKGMDSARALAILEDGAGTQWDPDCVRAFVSVSAALPAGGASEPR